MTRRLTPGHGTPRPRCIRCGSERDVRSCRDRVTKKIIELCVSCRRKLAGRGYDVLQEVQ